MRHYFPLLCHTIKISQNFIFVHFIAITRAFLTENHFLIGKIYASLAITMSQTMKVAGMFFSKKILHI